MKKPQALLCAIIAASAAAATSQSQAAAGLQHVTANSSASYAKTKYPIVFTHGMFGFTRIGFDSFGMDYFYQILPDLARNGANTFAAQVSPLESTEVRGEQLLSQVEEVLALTGQPKVNLIGHSHGGPTTRYIAAIKPEYVASVTGVAGTYRGSLVADKIQANKTINSVFGVLGDQLLAPIITWAEGNSSLPNSVDASLTAISEKGSAEFNAKFPTAALAANCNQSGAKVDNGVYYYSWTGTAQATNVLDVLDTVISRLAPLAYGNRDNDGLVGRCSTHIGQVIRDDYNHNHLDEVNMVFGLRSLFSPDPVALYRQHANRLKLQGL
ncbi:MULTISPECIES: triacylglycerol lipase [unclassified Acinetobacter]|uniref:lipase family alpha/beta hydrolase n=1 Tax=unclassified Acinetobacter TaxID=196816 RepID=UPI00211DE4CF|nr:MULTISPECIES: triacylglycerol lipase [unclassified Acinetobacter]UUS61120.1 triacylglycerol lipase [Acinetobacter sp. YH16056_T]